MNRYKGFSLVEVMVAITIIAVIGTITSTILTRSYKAGTDTTKISKLKQNGDLAVNQITDVIRTAEAVICYGGTATRKNSMVVRTMQGKYVKFKFVDSPTPTGGKTTSNGYIAKQENLSPSNQAIFCTDSLLTPTAVPITNQNPTSGVNISEGEFIKLTNTVSKDTVTIKFNVNDNLTAGATGSADLVPVQTTVQIR